LRHAKSREGVSQRPGKRWRGYPFGVIGLASACEEESYAIYRKKLLPSRSFGIDLCRNICLACVCGGDNFNS
jgi:hypothetical protein